MMKRIVGVVAMGILGLLSQLPLATSALAAPSPIAMPGTTGCQATPPPAPIASGTDPGVPGHWWNPNWYGTGWDFFFTSDPNQIVIYWLTYNANHQPVWLFNGGSSTAQTGPNGERGFWAPLGTVTHPPSGSQTVTPVGYVSILFLNGSNSVAALRWQWNAAGSGGVQPDECVYNLAQGKPPQTNVPSTVDQSYSGAWGGADASESGWGVEVTESTDTSGNTIELDEPLIYDTAGQAAWLQGSAINPPLSQTTISLGYIRSNYKYGFPIGDTSYLSCKTSSCITGYAGKGSWTRDFTSTTSGHSTLTASVTTDITSGASIAWPNAPYGTNNVAISRVSQNVVYNFIGVNQTSCLIPVGQSTCPVVVAWSATSATAQVYRRDLKTNALSASAIAPGNNGQYTDNLPAGADVQYELHDNSPTSVYTSAEVKVTAAAGLATPPAPTLAAPPADDKTSDGVGSTSGKFSVDQAGNTQYEISLYAPRGAGGLTPSVALVYNSGFGDGLLGYGWQLSGLSSISVCRQAPEHGDGPYSGQVVTTYPAANAYCLNGERMDLVSGSNGAVGAVYRLESDSMSEIVVESASTTDGQGSLLYPVPTTFAVYGKDGTVHRYGGSALLRYQPQVNGGYTMSWYEYQLQDSNGNTVNFNYTTPTPQTPTALVPTSITYAGGEIDFATTQRPAAQQSMSYQAGVPVITESAWIQSITVKSGAAVLRTYTPSYVPVPGAASLINPALKAITSWTECGGVGASQVCYPATTFAWANLNNLSTVQANSSSDSSFFHANRGAVKFGDIDGDGRNDVVYLHCDSAVDSNCGFQDFHIGFSTPTQAGGIGLNSVDICNASGNNKSSYDPNGPCPQLSKFLDATKSWQLVDFNGDGRSDLLMLEPQSGDGFSGPYRIVVWQSLGGNTTPATDPFEPKSTQKILAIAKNPQTGVTGSMTFNGKVDTFLADFDGDGLPDLLTIGASDALQVWLLKPTGVLNQPYVFQGPYSVAYGSPGAVIVCGMGSLTTQSLRAGDFNGDGRTDLVLRQYGTTGACGSTGFSVTDTDGSTSSTNGLQFVTASTFNATLQAAASSGSRSAGAVSASSSQVEYLQVFTSGGLSGGVFYFQPSHNLVWQVGQNTDLNAPYKNVIDDTHFQIADINGDGLADVMFAGQTIGNDTTVWLYELNQGGTRQPSQCVVVNSAGNGCAVSLGANETQLGDYDGDGKADFWTVAAWNPTGTNVYVTYLWTGNGFAATPITTNLYSGDIGTSPTWYGFLADMDGDGHVDALEINPASSGASWQSVRSRSMYQPRNVVTSIMSGLGAITGVTYSPLTYTSVYYREYTGFSLASGWGSPVQDVLSPRYVVSLAQSSAPTSTSINALSNVRYRYSGFKMQGGGRGSLGFDKVYSIDGQTGIETVTAYNQAFPLTGTPNATAAYTDGVAVDSVCGNPDSAACMAYGTVTDIQANQQLLSSTQDNWAWHVFNQPSNNYSTALSAPSPIYVLRSTNHTWKYGLDQTLLSSQATGFVYDVTYGNALNTFSTEYSGVQHFSRNAVRNTTTIQTYNNVDVPPTSANSYKATWHISRLLTSQTTVTPWAAGVADTAHAITRNSEFAYDANTGQLTAEHLQPLSSTDGAPAGTADQALDKYHFYDAYGNETETVTCSASMACSSSVPLAASAMAFHSTNQNSVQRYSRSDYSATGGIYANTTYAPFWNGSGATEKTTLTVNARDGFGNPTQTTDMHGVVAVSKYSALGRAYFTATNTGVAAQTIYRFCSGYGAPAVPCPPGAAYRVDTNTTAGTGGNSRAPETWAYFDVLTRPVLKLEQGFASGQYNAVQTTYDSLGRVYQQSEPYLTYAPTSASIGVPIGPIYYTTTQYDALGRVVSVMHPNSFATTTTYTGLDTTVTMPNNGTGYVETKKQTLNLLGQVAIVTDAVGSTLKYYYDATGNVTQVDRAGNDGRTASTFMGYDTLSRKTSLNDPDAGNWTYQYNALAEQVIKLNSSATPTCTVTAYDGQGRPFSRLDYANASCSGATDASATWTYDTAGNGLGSLATSTSTDNPSSINGIATTELRYAYYDSFGRVSELDTSINGVQYKQFSTYDQYGRAFQSLFSGTGLPQSGELYSYNSLGYLYQTQDAENGLAGQIYQTIGAVDARGHVTQEQRANNPALTTVRSYRPDNGWLSGISTGSPSGGTTNGAIENLAYGYDKVGNMVSRTDTSPGAAIYEKSSYDILQRLTQQLVGPSDTGPFTPTISRTYDSFGNPNPSSSLYGTYSTNAAAPKCGGAAGPTEVPTPGPDAPIGDTGGVDVRCYDSHGNVTRLLEQGNTPTVVKRQEWYNSYDAARRVAFSASFESHTTDWAYGGDRQRLLRADYLNSTASGSPKVTHYLGNAEIVNATGWPRTVKRYVPGMVLSQTLSGTGTTTQQYEFLFTDNLGSTHRIVDQNGAIENPNGSQWFTPFGVRASVANGTNLDRTTRFGFDDSLTHHGFTGHEQMDESALIHMNGRIYDANGGGFEQADPFVQDPGNLQSYNRYIYLMNNPLTGTDPSGYWGRRQQGYAREVVAIAIAIYTGYYYSAAHLGAAEAAAMAASGQTAMATIMTGYLSGFISSGNLSGAVEGAFDAGLNYGIGFVKNPVANVGAHALEGGVMSAIQGGRFGHGFVSAGLNAVISPKIAEHLGTGFKGGVASAIAGGTISQLTGGKFANGAMTATFEYSFNEMLHYGVDENGRGTTSLSEPDPHAAEELRFVAGFIPGVDLVACGISGCSGVEWVMAGLAIIPGEGKAASVVEGVVAKVVRTRAETLAEQLSLKEAEAGAGRRIMQGQQMKDPKFPAEEWAKMQHVHTTPEGQNIVIHYWERIEDAFRTGFKFKD